MEIRQFHKALLIDPAIVPVLFDTIERCDALRNEAMQIVSDTAAKQKEGHKKAQDKAQRLVDGAKRKIAKREAELDALRDDIVANTADERMAALTTAIAEIEASVAELVVQSLRQLFDAIGPTDVIVATVRRAIKQHQSFDGLMVQLNPDERDAIKQALGPEYADCVVADAALAPGEVQLVSPSGTVDLSPKAQLDSLAAVLQQGTDDST